MNVLNSSTQSDVNIVGNKSEEEFGNELKKLGMEVVFPDKANTPPCITEPVFTILLK